MKLPRGSRPGALPKVVPPMLPKLERAVPTHARWIAELKADGYRMGARIADGDVRLVSRNGHDFTERIPGIVGALAALPVRAAYLDGEAAVVLPDGTTSFRGLRRAMGRGSGLAVTYFAFDLLHLDGQDLRDVPLLERKALLRKVLGVKPVPTLRYVDHITGRCSKVYAFAQSRTLEGVVCKVSDSVYRSGRTSQWIKVKVETEAELVIGGWSGDELLVGRRAGDGTLQYAGRVPGAKARSKALCALRRGSSPFVDGVVRSRVEWVEPTIAVRVRYTPTTEGVMRHPRIVG